MNDEIKKQMEELAASPRVTYGAESAVVELAHPVQIDGSVVTKLTISRRTKGKHMRGVNTATNDTDVALVVLARRAGVRDELVDEMDEEDIQLCLAAMGKCQASATGKS